MPSDDLIPVTVETRKRNFLGFDQGLKEIGSNSRLNFSVTGDLAVDTRNLLQSIPGQEGAINELEGGKEPRELLTECSRICDQIIVSGDTRYTYNALAVRGHIKRLLQPR